MWLVSRRNRFITNENIPNNNLFGVGCVEVTLIRKIQTLYESEGVSSIAQPVNRWFFHSGCFHATFYRLFAATSMDPPSFLRNTHHWRFVSFRSPSLFYLLVHSRCRGFLFSLDHTQTHTTVGRTPLDEGSAPRRELYLATQTLYKRQASMQPVGFETTIPASARPLTYALDRAATGIGMAFCLEINR
jgi:hypothetical protein